MGSDPTPTDRRILVRVDADIADLIPGFLENRRKDVEALTAALIAGSFEDVAMLGHRMKGAGAGYGFQGISEIGRDLERAAAARSAEAARAQIEALRDYLERVEIRAE